MKNLKFSITLLVLFVLMSSCGNTDKIEIVHKKSFGSVTTVYMCYTKTSNYDEMRNYGNDLVEDDFVAFVYFYNDKNKIKDIRNYKNLDDALPEDGYIAKLDKSPGLGIQFEK